MNKKLSKRNIEALGKVNFSVKIDFSVGGELKIGEIKNIERSEPVGQMCTDELNKIFNSVRLTRNRKELLQFHFLSLKETYFLKGKKHSI